MFWPKSPPYGGATAFSVYLGRLQCDSGIKLSIVFQFQNGGNKNKKRKMQKTLAPGPFFFFLGGGACIIPPPPRRGIKLFNSYSIF